ncbi:MAG: hypothetical protein KME10_18065 [Plectolyngbya sp. WJT66-NPBG17]|nr:hypothetical protein [Plectolyngbya sp. WJT66-NPBG17]MBW4525122.1 hypothetical protein [Phormidium tanganyikae FI6-MK23]
MNYKSLLIWRRFARMQLSPWLGLIRSSYQAFQGCPQGQTHLMMSITKLNLLTLYDLLDDLIQYPPY